MKRFLSLVLAAVLALCALPAMAESAAPTKLTVLTTSKDDLSADYSMKKVAEKCNVEFEWVYLVEDTTKEKFQIMVNANELPDIILRPDALAGDANQAYALGVDSVFLDLIPAMEKYAPDMMALYQGYTDVWNASVKLGNNFGRNVALNANITDEKLEAAMRVLEYIASEEGSFLVRVGELGYNVQPADEGGLAIGGEKAYYRKNTEEEDEKLVVNGKITMTNDWNWIMRLEQSYQQAAADANPGDDWTYVHITMENKYYHIYVKDIGLYWPTTMIMDAEAVNEMALIQTEMKNYISSATTDFITGKRNVDTDWDAYLADLNKIQVEKFLTISQEQYDKGTAR